MKADEKLWKFCYRTLFQYAAWFDLPLKKVEILSPDKNFYGDCSADGRIRIQIREGKTPLHPYQIIDTMAHELAHLRHDNHKPEWFRLHVQILTAMQDQGEYKQLRQLHKKRR